MRRNLIRDFALATFVVAGIAITQAVGLVIPGSHVYSFGMNTRGELGIGTNSSPGPAGIIPSGVLSKVRFTAVDGGQQTSIAIGSDGLVYTWGLATGGQLGYVVNPSKNMERVPTKVPVNFGSNAIAASAGVEHMLVALANGAVMSWGQSNTQGQLGRAGTPSMPLAVSFPAGTVIQKVSAGPQFSLAVDDAGQLWAWGSNNSIQLGMAGVFTTPTIVPNVPALQDVSAGFGHAVALAADGSVWAWGSNSRGQAGRDPSTAGAIVLPAMVPNLANIIAVAAGANASFALAADGSLWGWGEERLLGVGSAQVTASFIPREVVVAGLPVSGITSVAAGAGFALASRDDGALLAWGTSTAQNLGLGGTTTPLATPLVVSKIGAGVTGVAAGTSHGFAFAGTPPISSSWSLNTSAPTCGATVNATVTLNGYAEAGLGNADVMLVLDESGSITAAQFNQLKTFAANFVNGLDVGPNATRVGIVQFATTARVVLTPSASKASILNTITNLVQATGNTCIGCGLNTADTTLDANPRAGASRYIVVVTDGANNISAQQNQTPAQYLAAAVTNAHIQNTVIAVGVGTSIDLPELEFIASDVPGLSTLFTTPDFDSLDDLIDILVGSVPGPGASNVNFDFDLGPHWNIVGAVPGLTGTTFTQTGNWTANWAIPTLDQNGGALQVLMRAFSGGMLQVPSSEQYADAQANAFVAGAPRPISVANCPSSLVLTPANQSGTVNTQRPVTATLKDDFGTPLGNQNVRFRIVGGPRASTTYFQTSVTNPQGVATALISSGIPVTDVVQASLLADPGFVSNTVTIEWLPVNNPPVANAGADQTVNLSGSPTAPVMLNGAGSSDDGQRQPLLYSWASNTGFSASGVTPMIDLPRGVHTFTLGVFDGENTRTDTVVITVVDPTPPVVTADVAGTQGLDHWYVSDVSLSWTIDDPESGIALTNGCPVLALVADTAGSSFTCTVTNGAGAQKSAAITIKRDATPPSIAEQADITVEAEGPAGAPVTYGPLAVTDAMSGPAMASAECAPPSGSTFPITTTPVVCTASDLAGNVAPRRFAVTVNDLTPPVITPSVAGVQGSNGWYRGPVMVSFTVTDPQSGIRISSGCDPTTVIKDTAGETFTCTATNFAGGSSTVVVTIMSDATPPVVTTGDNVSASATTSAGAIVTYADATATDATSGVSGGVQCAPASGSLFPIGTTVVTCSATDTAGNTGSSAFNVTVSDTTPPSITSAVTGTPGSNGWFTSPVQIVWTVSDPQSSVSTNGCDPVTLTADTPGVTVTCIASSAGGSASAGETVKIDLAGPVIAAPATINTGTTNPSGMPVNYPPASATDPTSGLASLSCLPASGSNFPIGTTHVTCTASDQAGNASTAGFDVNVRLMDSTPPSIVPSVVGTLGANGWFVSNIAISFAVTDGESAIASSTGCSAVTVSTDTAGQTFTCSATSEGGTTTQSVTVKRDATAPSLSAPGDISTQSASLSGIAVTYAAPAASDATSGLAAAAVCAPASGSTFPIGTTTVNCSVSDQAGNAAADSFTVTVAFGSNQPGQMHGEGHVMADNHRVSFDFRVVESPRRGERGRVEIRISRGRNGRWDDNRFESRGVDDVVFSNAPSYSPGKNPKSGIDTVVFTGTGKWDRRDGYTYIVMASDRGEPGRHADTFTIEVKAPNGQVVFSGGGAIADGNVQSNRVETRRSER